MALVTFIRSTDIIAALSTAGTLLQIPRPTRDTLLSVVQGLDTFACFEAKTLSTVPPPLATSPKVTTCIHERIHGDASARTPTSTAGDASPRMPKAFATTSSQTSNIVQFYYGDERPAKDCGTQALPDGNVGDIAKTMIAEYAANTPETEPINGKAGKDGNDGDIAMTMHTDAAENSFAEDTAMPKSTAAIIDGNEGDIATPVIADNATNTLETPRFRTYESWEDVMDDFEEMISTAVDSRDLSSPTLPCGIRDAFRQHQHRDWTKWTDKFYGGSRDPCRRSLQELGLYLDAQARWSTTEYNRGNLDRRPYDNRMEMQKTTRKRLSLRPLEEMLG